LSLSVRSFAKTTMNQDGGSPAPKASHPDVPFPTRKPTNLIWIMILAKEMIQVERNLVRKYLSLSVRSFAETTMNQGGQRTTQTKWRQREYMRAVTKTSQNARNPTRKARNLDDMLRKVTISRRIES
jgi:hypothetical protein